MKQKFYHCKHCGNIIAMVKNGGAPVRCCGEPMREIIPSTTEGAKEKHIPVYDVKGNTVKVSVGSVEHPMSEEHSIEWVCLESKQGSQFKNLAPSDPPRACFSLCDGDEVEAVYAYCNLHGLWMA